ncbi:TetR/AcrR family transcriptional regulator [Nocardioides astragali]|uniref:TetR/AcrR family transcriptional regulator n=1 Tax=Nocardioides astragali TaxID=1776736 RepID=A0ABW2N586_9ACTN|nr:TetR/AcrR family transcriptional regulator [Nocardioides astragali]
MPKQRTRANDRGESSRLALLEATLQLAGERGYVGTTMARITKATGLPASSVYWHFGSKDQLIAEAVAHGFEVWRSHATPWSTMDISLPRAARLHAELEKVVLSANDRLDYWRMGLLLALETGPAVGTAPRERFLGIRRVALERLEEWWAAALEADEGVAAGSEAGRRHAVRLARLTLAALDGMFVACLAGPTDDVAETLTFLAVGLDAVAHQLVTGNVPAPAPPPRRTSTDPAPESRDSRLRLLRAAGEVAAQSGYEGASIARICQQAGLPASSLYWHFTDKDDLLGAVVEHSYAEWYAEQPAWDPPASDGSWPDELRSHLSVSLGSLVDQPIFLRLGYLLLLLRRDDPPAARARFMEVRQHARHATDEWFADASPVFAGVATPASIALMALSDGLFFSNQLDTETWDPAVFGDLVTRLLEAAVAPARQA